MVDVTSTTGASSPDHNSFFQAPTEEMSPLGAKKVSSPTHDASHTVTVAILGVAGIDVARGKARNVGKSKEYPPPPTKMKAVVTVSQAQEVKGTSVLSKPLALSPSEEQMGPGSKKSTRHVAVWAAPEGAPIGSTVSFEETLDQLDIGDSCISDSQYVPKSYELTIALVEDNAKPNKVAVPIGVANLTVSGDQDEPMVVDLPILDLRKVSLLAAKKNGLGFFHVVTPEAATPKKKKGFGRLLGRRGSKKIPSVSDQTLFRSVYSTDPDGDAVLRVRLQVINKEPEHRKGSKSARAQKESPVPGEDGSECPTSKSACDTVETAPNSADSVTANSLSDDSEGSEDVETLISVESGTLGSATCETFDDTILSDTVEVQNPPIYSSPIATEAFNGCTQEWRNLASPEIVFDEDEFVAPIVFTVFGREVTIPRCGQLIPDDDLTHVTGDYFGQDVQIPMCSALKPLYDDDTVTLRMDETFDTVEDRTTQRKTLLKQFFGAKMAKTGKEDDTPVLLRTTDKPGPQEKPTISGNTTKKETEMSGVAAKKELKVSDNTTKKGSKFSDNGSNKESKVSGSTTKVGTEVSGDVTNKGPQVSDDTTKIEPHVSGDNTQEKVLADTTKKEPKVSDDTTQEPQKVPADAGSLEEILGSASIKRDGSVSKSSVETPRRRLISPVETPIARETDKSLVFFADGKNSLEPSSKSSKKSERMTHDSDATPRHQTRSRSMAESIVAMFHCVSQGTSTVDDKESTFTPLDQSAQLDVPSDLEIPSDLNSLDDLTVITGPEFKHRRRSKQKPAKSGIPFPVALGGSGMCSNVHLVDDPELQRAVEQEEKESNQDSNSPKVKENYFADYDDYSIARPRTRDSFIQKVPLRERRALT